MTSRKNGESTNVVDHESVSVLPSKGVLLPAAESNHRKRKRVVREDVEDEEVPEDSKEEVEKKIVELQKIVPGGESLDNVDNLFEETAGYILDLQNQIKGLKVLSSFFELLEKQKSKLGG